MACAQSHSITGGRRAAFGCEVLGECDRRSEVVSPEGKGIGCTGPALVIVATVLNDKGYASVVGELECGLDV